MDRFWSKVDTTGDCWIWTGAKSSKGYGRFKIGGKLFLPHRIAWEEEYGPIPDGVCILHKCDNPPCVRPSHMFSGSKSDNMIDCRDKGRLVTPDNTGKPYTGPRKLTVEQVQYIRDHPKERGLGRRFGVDKGLIWQIRNNRIWNTGGIV